MATFIQGNAGAAFTNTQVQVTLTGVTAGHSIRAAVAYTPNTLSLSSVSDGTNTYTQTSALINSTYNMHLAYWLNSPGGSVTVTATANGSASGINLLIEEWSGDATSSQPDGTPIGTYTAGSTGGTNCPAGNITTTNDGDSIWCPFFNPQGVAPTLGSGFSQGTSFNLNNSGMTAEYQTQTTHGVINPAWTSNTGDNDCYVCGIAFKPVVTATHATVWLLTA